MAELRKFKIKISSKGVEKEYEMQECLWIDDMSLQMQCQTKDGDLIARQLWTKRIAAATGKSENDIMRLPHWELTALITKWMEINQPDAAIFLEDSQKEQKDSSSSTTS